ncbi:SEN1 N terminal-domain-containing protein [Syncephalis fuscata]|nr:SEN1 N terminal-domain-containing protein [Syncephalis fuscata]
MTNVAETLEARLNSLLCKLEQLYTDNYGSPDTQSWLDAFHRFLLDGLVVFFEDERSCWWCDPARRPIVTEILHVFSLPESDSVVRFKQINACMLSRCRGCIAGYYTAKEQLRKLYRRRYPPENIDRFFSIIDTWDQARLIRGLSTTNEINNTPNTTSTLTTSLYEIFSVSKLLHCTLIRDAVNTAIINTPKSILATLPLSMAVTQLPGIFCLVCSNQSQVRNWAAHVIMESIEYNSTLQWKDTLQQQQQQKEEKQKQNEENTNYNDTVDKVAQSYGIVTQYVIRSSIQQQQQQSYATFTARFWRLTYKLVRSLPADKEKHLLNSMAVSYFAN